MYFNINYLNKVKNAEWSKLDITNIFNQVFVPNVIMHR